MDASLNQNKGKMLQVLGAVIGWSGLLIILLGWFSHSISPKPWLYVSLVSLLTGITIYSIGRYGWQPAGIKNDHNWSESLTGRGLMGYLSAAAITLFYVLLYWYPAILGLQSSGENTGVIAFFDPLSKVLNGGPASQWFVYGTLYTLAIVGFGIKFIYKYRHNKYQILRTISVMFFQTGFAFIIPEILVRLNYPYNDFKNMWPLNYYFFEEWNVKSMLDSGAIGLFMLIFGVAMIFIISPVLTYLYGKRWYCSWVCGCGGLAETAGDPFRHLSDNGLKAWKLERWLIHSVLVFSIVMTAAVIYSYLHGNPSGFWVNDITFIGILILIIGFVLFMIWKPNVSGNLSQRQRIIITSISGAILFIAIMNCFTGQGQLFWVDGYQLRKTYGFLIGAAFSGVIGVGFYPLLGSRVWCRFGCPMAAILGIQQRWFSRFRITTNGGQCISCGNCSTYCEMGIDVRSYAQKGQNIVRASCVGCGICAAVCPRGVLKLENGSVDLFNRTSEIRNVHVKEGDIGLL